MELRSIIAYIETIEPGTSVSYGDAFVVDCPTCVIATPVGCGDDYPQSLSNEGAVLMREGQAGILERICIGQFVADIADIPEAAEGGQMILIGKDREECITVEELTRVDGGFRYEIICGIGKRVPRVYLRDGKAVGQKDYFNDIYGGFGYI